MSKEWWKAFFGKKYVDQYTTSGVFKYTKREVNFLAKVIPLKKGIKILDLCCGHGRHAIEFARKGYIVTGLDYSKYEIDLARREAQKQKLSVDFRVGDARRFRFKNKFDIIVNLFTAFGYGSKEDDKKIIQNVSRSLKKGGKFFIDLRSQPWLIKHFKPFKRERIGSRMIISRRVYDFENGVLRDTRTEIEGRKRKVIGIAIRLYSLTEIKDLLEPQGLRVIKVFGSYLGKPFGFNEERMLILAKKQ